jgi:hypothetical protein
MRSTSLLIVAVAMGFALLLAPELVISAAVLAAVSVLGFGWFIRRSSRGVRR